MSTVESPLAMLVRGLERMAPLPERETEAFLALPFNTRRVAAGDFIMRDEDNRKVCLGLLSGFAYRHKIVGGGGRQILSVHFPGDLIDLQNLLLPVAHHSTQMLTAGLIAVLPARAMLEAAARHPALGQAMWLDTLVDGAIAREWLANVGRRDARSRISHLLCEFAVRMHAIGLCRNGSFELPMTQEQIADATGLTPIHVNRTLQALRSSGLIISNRRTMTIGDWKALAHLGDFNPDYLYPNQRRDGSPAAPPATATSRAATASATLMPSTAADRMPPA